VFVLPVAVKLVGGNNIVLYIMDVDDCELPSAFVANIVRVYVIPLCNPLILVDVAGALNVLLTVSPLLGTAVTVYVFTVPIGSVNETLIVVSVLPVAVKFVGGFKILVNVLYEIDDDESEFPSAFVAIMLKVYVISLCNPVILYEVAGALKV
jgi:hypothetical protein